MGAPWSPRRGRRVAVAVAAAALVAAGVVGAPPAMALPGSETARVGPLSVEVQVPFAAWSAPTPVIVEARPRTPGGLDASVLLEVHVECIVGQQAEARIEVAPTGVTRRTLWLLPAPYGDLCHGVEVALATDAGSRGRIAYAAARQDLPGVEPAWLAVDPERELTARASDGAVVALFAPRDENGWGLDPRVLGITPAELPDRWQAYPSHFGVVLTAGADAALRPTQRKALERFGRAGHALAIVDEGGELAARWSQAVGRPVPRVPRVLDPSSLAMVRVDPPHLDDDGAAVEPPRPALPAHSSLPVAGFAVLVLLFAVVAGPLNLWWVRRRRRPWLFLWTTPALSALICLGLFSWNIVGEGVTLRRASQQLVVAVPERGEALAWTTVGYFAPFAPSPLQLGPRDRFEGRVDSGQHDHGYDPYGMYAPTATVERTTVSLDGAGPRVSGAWIPTRLPRAVAMATAMDGDTVRLTVRRGADGPELVNGTPHAIEVATWRDGQGRLHQAAGPAAPGATVTLEPLEAGRDPLEARDVRQQIAGLGHAAHRVWARHGAWPWSLRARLDAPLAATPGPDADDEGDRTGWLVATVPADGASWQQVQAPEPAELPGAAEAEASGAGTSEEAAEADAAVAPAAPSDEVAP